MKWLLTPSERQSLKHIGSMLKLRPGSVALSILYGVATLGAAIGLAATSAWLIARASQMPPVLYLTVAAVAVRLFGVSRAVLRYMQRIASHKVALQGMDSLRLGVYDALMEGPLDNVARLQRGDLLARIGADIDAVGDYVVKSFLPFAVAGIVGLGTVVGFAFLSVPSALILAAGLLVSGLIAPAITARSVRLAESEEQAAKQDLAVTTLATMESSEELAVAGDLPAAYGRLNAASTRLNAARARAARPGGIAGAVDRFAMGAVVIGVLLVAIPETNAGLVAAVALAVLVLTPLAAFEATSDLGGAAVQMVRSARAAQRIDDLLGMGRQASSPTAAAQPHTVPHLDDDADAVLQAKDLAVGWPGRPIALQDVDLTVRPGDVVAIVGPSGIGKSTLLYTLAGMLPPKAGTASLNGVPAWGAQREQVAKVVSLTTEDAHVFATTVVENIRVGRADLTDEEAIELLSLVGLRQWLESLPNGLHTMLGISATSISGGERRRLLLARALASPAAILLLDEPGEHLDPVTADQVLGQLLAGAGTERGLVIVTHRLTNLRPHDRVLLLEPGKEGDAPARVVADTSHADLMASSELYSWARKQEDHEG